MLLCLRQGTATSRRWPRKASGISRSAAGRIGEGIHLQSLVYHLTMPNPSLRVLHVVHSLGTGGTECVLVRVANRLSERGFDFHVCCLGEAGELVASMPRPDQVHALCRSDGWSLRTVAGLRRVFRHVAPDVIHTHNIGPLLYAAPASRWGLRWPILHGEHAQMGPRVGTRYAWLSRLLYTACRRVHTVSENQLADLRSLGFASQRRSLAVANGVDLELFRPGASSVAEELALPAGSRLLGVVGRLIASKHHVRLVQGLAQLPADVHLVVIGDGEVRSQILAEAGQLGCADRVHLMGTRSDMVRFYQAMDLLVVSSDSEGLSNVILEAMACATPVVANSYCGGCDEVITHGQDGWLLPMDTPERVAAAIREALSSAAELDQRGNRARQTIAERFNFERTVDQYEATYRLCASRRRSPVAEEGR